MRKITYLLFFCIILMSSCRAFFGVTDNDLIDTVSIETGCPKDKIKIIDKIKSLGNATYSLDVCGKRVIYKQVGSVFMEKEKADKLFKQ